MIRILIGDCVQRMKDLPDNSVDSVVCDPPYHLLSTVKRFGNVPRTESTMPKAGPYRRASKGFMGQTWDGGDVAFQPETWAEVLRVLKPGGHLVAFSGTRTYHRMAVAIEDAGFEVRDMIAWHYGSGFPKSHDISKAIDKAAGAEREVIGISSRHGGGKPFADGAGGFNTEVGSVTAPATDAAREWKGWGTALKPATEPICLARKPLSEKSIAANVLKWGTGALNIDGCRIEGEFNDSEPYIYKGENGVAMGAASERRRKSGGGATSPQGRWPANLCHDGSDEVVAGFPSETGNGYRANPSTVDVSDAVAYAGFGYADRGERGHNDSGSAARFFYCAKAATDERGEGNNHPTVKPVSLMRWLVRLVTPKGGTVLDPFAGSGSTLIAADAEQFNAIGCELSPEYAEIARRRISEAAGMFAQIKTDKFEVTA